MYAEWCDFDVEKHNLKIETVRRNQVLRNVFELESYFEYQLNEIDC